jgi:rhamnosyltransferase subunit B
LGAPCVLLSKHWRQAEDLLREGVLACDYVDLGHLLPKSRLLVHHGGIGTCAQAIRAGIPQLSRPLHIDQFENAYRVHTLGLGTYLFKERFNGRVCQEQLAKMLRRAPQMKTLANYAKQVRSDNGLERAARVILEALMREPLAQHRDYAHAS